MSTSPPRRDSHETTAPATSTAVHSLHSAQLSTEGCNHKHFPGTAVLVTFFEHFLFTHVLNSSSLLSLDTNTISNGLPGSISHKTTTKNSTARETTTTVQLVRTARRKNSVDDGSYRPKQRATYSLLPGVKRIKAHCAREVRCRWFGYVVYIQQQQCIST